MSHLLRLGHPAHYWKCTLVMALAAVLITSTPSFAKLTADDIAALQQRAKDEGWTFTVGWTPACEYSLEELCGFDPNLAPADDAELIDPPFALDSKDLPSRFDWRDSATLPPIRNQLGCGSCWAFATIGPLECNIAIKQGLIVDLSEQWLLSCNPYGYDCEHGGFSVPQMFLNVGDACGGIGAVMESEFPYIEANGTCECPYTHHYWIRSYASLTNNVATLKNAILEYGPIMVSVHVEDDPWNAYTGGVYNLCVGGPTNHAVTLVGWDDSQGPSGVWFMRNSWGSFWGEDGGYMRIPYGCDAIGSNPKRIYYQPLVVSADQNLGRLPLTVNFTAETPGDTITDCAWSFGDSHVGYGAATSHTYNQVGIYTIQTELSTPHAGIDTTITNMIAVHCDSVKVVSREVAPNTKVGVNISLRNFLPVKRIRIPFTWAGDFNMTNDSVTVTGLRSSYFNKSYLHYHAATKRATVELSCPNGQPLLAAGTGPVVTLWFTIPGTASTGVNPISIISYSSFAPALECAAGNYVPDLTSGQVEIPDGCCVGDMVGNIDGSPDDAVSLGDLTALLDCLFISLNPAACPAEADVDRSGYPNPTAADITLGDLTKLIDHLFISLMPLPPCP